MPLDLVRVHLDLKQGVSPHLEQEVQVPLDLEEIVTLQDEQGLLQDHALAAGEEALQNQEEAPSRHEDLR